ncbi:hypothetical protein [Rhizorhapis suberifaciens]|uniref:Uncharacterized protein n=1 Tax=Rhizorhapis suberifaciens TaxID=13656 RepID=A0A840HZJ2_9SPHN|nr:hypothetical protein [Rhizorhapis suberifaciens]MBB4642928.1 hypothetical protein [Rhizorhapis suberifaciens]
MIEMWKFLSVMGLAATLFQEPAVAKEENGNSLHPKEVANGSQRWNVQVKREATGASTGSCGVEVKSVIGRMNDKDAYRGGCVFLDPSLYDNIGLAN